MDITSQPLTEQHLWWATVASTLFVAAAATIVVPLFGWPSLSTSGGAFAVAIGLAVALVGWVSWLGVERYSSEHPVLGGVVAGVVTGIVSHPVAWFLGPVIARSDLGGGSVFLLPFMSVFSLLLLVWFTVPLGIIAGVTTGLLRVATHRRNLQNGLGSEREK
ncbi:hypothetical protein [Haloarcula japonica]|uniref:Uncharacterized protein n=1 Tax=Haloarcula japonica (strain ATCC 49778 / DSM 6131 / JCM 7785 / NBRC 101032 / NCIMB 13157 / TR-1) TaxID=1227453 RepID=M0LHB7_HALJT|nr:hypothetical protein [Haloarcula japonica]EMA32921.1 hypothetical protein C444_06851 [Haloarcula japonica DSM 6131]